MTFVDWQEVYVLDLLHNVEPNLEDCWGSPLFIFKGLSSFGLRHTFVLDYAFYYMYWRRECEMLLLGGLVSELGFHPLTKGSFGC
jgi:hypothetical protein